MTGKHRADYKSDPRVTKLASEIYGDMVPDIPEAEAMAEQVIAQCERAGLVVTLGPHDCSRDQACVDWARGEVEKVVAWCREAETDRRAKGELVAADKYRFAANTLELRLVSSGCVISPFSEKGPVVRRLLNESTC